MRTLPTRGGTDRLRSRLPRGHLRHLFAGDQRQAARTAPRRRRLPDLPPEFSRMAMRSWSSRGARVRSPIVRISSATGRPLIASSTRAGSSPSAPARRRTRIPFPVPKENADLAMDAAQCIGCGACVAACKNASAMLFVASQGVPSGLAAAGQPERYRRVKGDGGSDGPEEGFRACTVTGSCEAVSPQGNLLDFIARLNRDYASPC